MEGGAGFGAPLLPGGGGDCLEGAEENVSRVSLMSTLMLPLREELWYILIFLK